MMDNDGSTTHSAQDQHTHYQRFMTSHRQITLMSKKTLLGKKNKQIQLSLIIFG